MANPPTTARMRRVYRRRRFVALLGVVVALTLAGRGVSTLVTDSDAATEPRAAAESAGAATTTSRPEPCPPGGWEPPPTTDEAPAELRRRLDEALGHRSFDVRQASVSVWVEGYGEVAALEPDLPLVPASNQKVLVAMGALILLPHDLRLDTEVLAAGRVRDDGTVEGDLVVVGGGDAMIKRTGPHSLEKLARIVRDAGITRVTGSILGDESRYDRVRDAPGWLDWQQPLPGGAMSALMVNSNARIGAPDYLADPTPHNAELIREAFENAGIRVDGGSAAGTAPDDAEQVAVMRSYTVVEMVHRMLRESDNMVAEMLTKEIGLRESGIGSTGAGLAAIEAAVEAELCVDNEGINDDASGISRDNARSAREWRTMLQAARDEEWWPVFRDGLALAGDQNGTLRYRFVDTPAEGNLRAKTGTVGVSVALSGYLSTEGGRDVVFSAVANGSDPDPAVRAIDRLLIGLAGDRS